MKRLSTLLMALLGAGSLSYAAATMTPASNTAVNDDPFAAMDRIFQMQMKQMEMMQKQMDQIFRNFQQGFGKSGVFAMPGASFSRSFGSNLVDKGDHYELTITVGDLKNSKVDITTENGMLTVSVSSKRHEEKQQGSSGKVIQFASSSSVQSFTLPPDADAAKITAKEHNGAIVVTIPKKAGSASQRKVIPIEKASDSNQSKH
ncbi:Hsp20/alpha crystallin family protein [Nitratifractor sp.]